MRYYENTTLDQLILELGKQVYMAIVPHNNGWMVYFCRHAYNEYKRQNNFTVAYCTGHYLDGEMQ